MHVQGLIAAPFTAMYPNGTINLDAIDPYVDLLSYNGVKGAFVCGTTGEGMSLTLPERKSIAAHWLNVAPNDFKIIVHVGHMCLEDSKDLASPAQRQEIFGSLTPQEGSFDGRSDKDECQQSRRP